MTSRLEDEFDLPKLPDIRESRAKADRDQISSAERVRNAIAHADKISKALPAVTGLELHEDEMDHIAELAEDAFIEFIKLSQDVEIKDAATMGMVANNMLKLAQIAKNSKADKKLAMVEMMIRQKKLELDEERIMLQKTKMEAQKLASAPGGEKNPVQAGHGQVLATREEILAKMAKDAVKTEDSADADK